MAIFHEFARLLWAGDFINLVGAETSFARFAIDHRIAERRDVAARLPDFRRHDDGRFEAGDVVALTRHRVPPEFLHVALEFRAQRAVVPKAVDAAVDFRRLVNESPP